MVHEMIDGTYRQTNLPNESPEYLAKREELRLAEIELLNTRERVAALRRGLPKGATVQDYEFLDCNAEALPNGRATAPSPTADALPDGRATAPGPTSLDEGDEPVRKVRLSELFSYAPHPNPLPRGEGEKAPDRSLVIYHFMYGKKQTSPCPMCTAWIDSFNGVAHHLAQSVDLAIVAAADPSTLRAHARKRGWDKLRLLSAGESTFKYDLGSEDREGNQDSTVSVFIRDGAGTVRHFYSAHPSMSKEIRERGIDLLSPVYNMLDLTPHGRGDWYAELGYGTKVPATHR